MQSCAPPVVRALAEMPTAPPVRSRAPALVLAAVLVFVGYRGWLSWELWQGRALPPEPDDSFTYISATRSVVEQGDALPDTAALPRTSSERVKGLPYTLTVASLALLTGLDVAVVYRLLFFLVLFPMAGLIFFLLRQLFEDDRLAALGLVSLAFFTGDGDYHGFFWVVPSYFGLLAFFLVIALLRSPLRNAGPLLAAVAPFYLLSHPLNAYALGAVGVYAALLWWLQRSQRRALLVRSAWFAVALIVVAVAFASFQRQAGIGTGPVANVTELVESSERPPALVNPDSWALVRQLFVGRLVPDALTIGERPKAFIAAAALGAFVLLGLLLALRERRWPLVAFAGGTAAFGLVAQLSPFGPRSLLYLWPAVFVLVALSVGALLRQRLLRLQPSGVTALGIVLVAIAATGQTQQGLAVVRGFNAKVNVPFRTEIFSYLRAVTRPGERILFADKFSETYVIRGGNLTDRAPVILPATWRAANPPPADIAAATRFIVATDSTLDQDAYRESLSAFLRVWYDVRGASTVAGDLRTSLQLAFDQGDTGSFGHLKVYRILDTQVRSGEVTTPAAP